MNILKGLVMAWLLLIAVNVMAKQQEGAQSGSLGVIEHLVTKI
jgi:hypothetical protein